MVTPKEISPKNLSMFSPDIMQMPSRRRGPVWLSTSHSLPRWFPSSSKANRVTDLDENEEEDYYRHSIYQKNFVLFPGMSRSTASKKAKEERHNFLKHFTNKEVAPIASDEIYKSVQQDSYKNFPSMRPMKHEDKSSLRLAGDHHIITENRLKYIPWFVRDFMFKGTWDGASSSIGLPKTPRINLKPGDSKECNQDYEHDQEHIRSNYVVSLPGSVTSNYT